MKLAVSLYLKQDLAIHHVQLDTRYSYIQENIFRNGFKERWSSEEQGKQIVQSMCFFQVFYGYQR